MIEGVPFGALDGVGVVGVVLIVGWLLATGRLVTRNVHDDVRHDRDEWRASHRISESARAEAVSQVQELLEHARTTDTFIRSLPHPQDTR